MKKAGSQTASKRPGRYLDTGLTQLILAKVLTCSDLNASGKSKTGVKHACDGNRSADEELTDLSDAVTDVDTDDTAISTVNNVSTPVCTRSDQTKHATNTPLGCPPNASPHESMDVCCALEAVPTSNELECAQIPSASAQAEDDEKNSVDNVIADHVSKVSEAVDEQPSHCLENSGFSRRTEGSDEREDNSTEDAATNHRSVTQNDLLTNSAAGVGKQSSAHGSKTRPNISVLLQALTESDDAVSSDGAKLDSGDPVSHTEDQVSGSRNETDGAPRWPGVYEDISDVDETEEGDHIVLQSLDKSTQEWRGSHGYLLSYLNSQPDQGSNFSTDPYDPESGAPFLEMSLCEPSAARDCPVIGQSAGIVSYEVSAVGEGAPELSEAISSLATELGGPSYAMEMNTALLSPRSRCMAGVGSYYSQQSFHPAAGLQDYAMLPCYDGSAIAYDSHQTWYDPYQMLSCQGWPHISNKASDWWSRYPADNAYPPDAGFSIPIAYHVQSYYGDADSTSYSLATQLPAYDTVSYRPQCQQPCRDKTNVSRYQPVTEEISPTPVVRRRPRDPDVTSEGHADPALEAAKSPDAVSVQELVLAEPVCQGSATSVLTRVESAVPESAHSLLGTFASADQLTSQGAIKPQSAACIAENKFGISHLPTCHRSVCVQTSVTSVCDDIGMWCSDGGSQPDCAIDCAIDDQYLSSDDPVLYKFYPVPAPSVTNLLAVLLTGCCYLSLLCWLEFQRFVA
mgnify:CR=1 FL=1